MKHIRKPHGLQHDTEELVANIAKLMAEAEEMLNESTSHHAEEKVALLNGNHAHSEHRLFGRYLAAKDKVTEFAKRADNTIRSCPYESLVIAVGVGILLGSIFSRREE
jgi:ElaB/YqjD/DUF883 family membrane-anchored ribosome-binding protein